MSKRIATDHQERAVRLIESTDSFYLATHIRPDGDALGSLLALALGLEAQSKRVARLCADAAPENYHFLPQAERVCAKPPAWTPDVGIVVDCDGLSRLGPLEATFAALPHVIDIDHHASGQTFGEARLVDARAAATGEIIFHLLTALEIACDPDIATCLYAAILTDTGRFCYGNTTAESLSVAAALVQSGADPHYISRRIYEGRSVAATHLLGIALSRLSANHDSQVVSSTLTQGDFAQTNATPSDTEGIIDHLRSIGGPQIAILFVEMDKGDVRVSMRSDGSVDVSQIALGFGGGGHMMAAGCTVQGRIEDVRARVLVAARRSLAGALPGDGP
jgi:phosphoesterase RecJ-like protein